MSSDVDDAIDNSDTDDEDDNMPSNNDSLVTQYIVYVTILLN